MLNRRARRAYLVIILRWRRRILDFLLYARHRSVVSDHVLDGVTRHHADLQCDKRRIFD